MKKLLALLLLPLFPSFAQIKSDTIAFTLNRQSNICLKAKIDNSDTLILMFHTSASDITLTREAIKKKITFKLDKTDEVQTWGGMAKSEKSENHTFLINGLKWQNMTVFADENSGVDTDGKFGCDIFKNKIVSIDYDKKQMIVSEVLPSNLAGYNKMLMNLEQGSMFIEGILNIGNEKYKDKFMFHSGYGRSILLDPKIAEKYSMNNLKTIETSELRDSFNNVIKIETKEIPDVEIAGLKIMNVPLSIAAQSSQIPMKVFGNDLLKRFNIIFDFQKSEIYFKPNSLWQMPYFRKS